MCDDNSVLSQQLASSRTRATLHHQLYCYPQDQILKNPYLRKEKNISEITEKRGHEIMKKLTHLQIKLLSIKVKHPMKDTQCAPLTKVRGRSWNLGFWEVGQNIFYFRGVGVVCFLGGGQFVLRPFSHFEIKDFKNSKLFLPGAPLF